MMWCIPRMTRPCRIHPTLGILLTYGVLLHVVSAIQTSSSTTTAFCPWGWKAEVDRCFRLFVSAQDYETARQNCQEQQASLAHVYPDFGDYAETIFGPKPPRYAWVHSGNRVTANFVVKRDTETGCLALELNTVVFTLSHRECAERLPYVCETTQSRPQGGGHAGDVLSPGAGQQQNSDGDLLKTSKGLSRVRRDVSTNVTDFVAELLTVDARVHNGSLPVGIADRDSFVDGVLREMETLLGEATAEEAATLVSSLNILGSILVRTLNSSEEESFTSSSTRISVRVVDPTSFSGLMFTYNHMTDEQAHVWFSASTTLDPTTYGVISYEVSTPPTRTSGEVNLPPENSSAPVMSRLIAAVFVDENGDHVTASGDVTVSLHNNARPQFSLPSCVSMTFDQRLYLGWSLSGCHVDDFSTHRTECTCPHSGAFAVAMAEQTTMGFLAWAGCAVTTLTSMITVMTLIGFRLITSLRSYIRVSFLVALASAEAIFFTGLNWSDVSGLCTMIAMALQFCVTATFTWLLCYVLYLGSEMRGTQEETGFGSHLYNMMGWLLPLCIVLISLIWARGGYRDVLYCWISGSPSTLFGGYFGPIALFVLLTLIVLIFDIKVYIQNKDAKRRYHWKVTWSGIRTVALLLPLLTVTWVMGALAVIYRGTYAQILFAICNILLGILIFVSMCWFNEEIRVARRAKKVVPTEEPIKNSMQPRESKPSGVNIAQHPFRKVSKQSLAAMFSAPSRIEPKDDAACMPLEQVGDSATEAESDARSENETTRLAGNEERIGRSTPPGAHNDVTSGRGLHIDVQPSPVPHEQTESSA